ncbi:probable ATP-dependent RNA helicase DDX20 [Oncorhynchus tshawytscha]|uniref:RNA helicase n=1 Tax=Oncorhynchus tshawytscha TaxID=74940 RepID=A0A8C8JBP9_ONCTS|nr:probable ATP-dependent RNA helicase DDX20 [Oncorhynchus tshawytscha]
MASSMKKAAHDIETRKRTDDVVLSGGIDFNALLLSQPVLDGLAASGFKKPSPIQLKAIPLGRCGLDLIVQAKSGTGKTCVFSAIALDSLVMENTTTQVLVLAPTREIAVQIHSVVMAIGSAMEGLQCHVFIGGTPVSQDKISLKKCHIAVGSPGRIKQLIELGLLVTASIRLFVLDEADKLLEEGSFQDQINWIFSSLPVNKQMLALSATYPESLAQHLAHYMREPTFVRLNPSDPGLIGLKQYYRLVRSHAMPHKVFEEKVLLLLELFSKVPFNQALVFSNLHTRAQHLADILSSKGLPAVCISGSLSQDQRMEAMSKLKQYQCRVLISTDLTSRGIDAEKVNLVINLDVPQDWETYMHRIGRAGRFGTHGLAVTYCCHGEEENKMMAIAQKCNLILCALPDPIEPGLMQEPCDWDITVEALTPGTNSQVFPKTERRRRAKTESPAPKPIRDQNPSPVHPESTEPSRPCKSQHTASPVAKASPMHKNASPALDVLLPPPKASVVPGASLALSRKEQQDALPKIPPLSAFKSQRSGIMTFQEAELDFQSFIREGLGRTVEVIRQFRGHGDDGEGFNGQHGYEESHTLQDDDVPLTHTHMTRNGERPPTPTQLPLKTNSDPSPLESTSDGSSSDCDMEEDRQADESTQSSTDQTRGAEHKPIIPIQTQSAQQSTVMDGARKPKCMPPSSQPNSPSVPHPSHHRSPRPEGRAVSTNPGEGEPLLWKAKDREATAQQWSRETAKKVKGEKRDILEERKVPENRGSERKRDRVSEVEEEEEDDGEGYEGYWRAYYRAWEDYYASMPPSHHQGYHGYHSMASSWMAAYRMNSVYMEELLKH